MTDAPESTTTAPDDQRALTVVKERLVAHSSEPMWDSAAFDHMGRVATVMAESGLCSDTLLNNDAGEPANPKTVVARMLMIAHMARECGANPLMFLQGCSRIGKKIHLEGKLVNAIVRARTGVNLKFEFGRWDTDHIELPELHEDGPRKGLPVDETFFHGIGERLAIRVSDPEDPTRHVEGSVGLWKTDRKGSPWASQGNWRRQLRYRGAPEWARAYEPGAVLGLYSDADEDIEDAADVGRSPGLIGRLSGSQQGNGFNADDVAQQTGPKKRKTKAEKAAEEALAAADAGVEPEEAMHAVDAEVEEIEADPPSAAPAESAAETPASSPSPEPSDISPTTPSNPTTTEAVGGATSASPSEHAAPGEVYLLVGDGYNNDKRRITYKNGVRFSTVHKDSEGKYTEYATHAPELLTEAELPEEPMVPLTDEDQAALAITITSEGQYEAAQAEYEAFFGNEPAEGTPEAARFVALGEALAAYETGRPTSPGADTETASAQPAEPEPATSEPATNASGDGGSTAADSGQSAPAAGDGPPPEYAEYINAVDTAETWAAVKKAMGAFYNTDFFKGLSPEKQNRVRANTWGACVESKAEGVLQDLPDHAEEMTAFRLWLETITDPDVIIGTKNVLEKQPQWLAEVANIQGNDQAKGARSKALIANINNAVDARLRALS